MVDDVNALGTVPTGLTPNNVPGHIQALKDSINAGSTLRRLTQAQIDALPATQKPIGVSVHNLTTGKDQRWNGSAWVPTDGSDRLPAAGGVLTGDLVFDSASVDGHKVIFKKSGVDGWRILALVGGVFAVQRRDPATGAYVDNPLLITAAGHVESRSHIAGTYAGTTNPAGYLNMTIGASPTGTWIVVANAQVAATGAPIACTAVQTAANTITFTVPNASTPIQLSWHAIAV